MVPNYENLGLKSVGFKGICKMLGPKQFWIPNNFGSKIIWITKIGSKKVLDAEAYWVQINVRSKNLLSPKFFRAQKI